MTDRSASKISRRAAISSPQVQSLRRLIEEDRPVAVPGIVLQELLSGVRTETEFERLSELMEGFPLVLARREHHISGARTANACRKAGISVSTVDCLIAAMAVERKAQLLTIDEDFRRMAPHCDLQLLY